MQLEVFRWPAYSALSAATIWALHFGIVYGVTAFACPRDLEHGLAWAVGVATVVAAGSVLALIAHGIRGPRPRGAPQRVALGVAILALAAILWQAEPLLLQQRCA